jgi:hypothetical protein
MGLEARPPVGPPGWWGAETEPGVLPDIFEQARQRPRQRYQNLLLDLGVVDGVIEAGLDSNLAVSGLIHMVPVKLTESRS